MNFDLKELIKDVQASKEFFDRSTRPLGEDDSMFAPTPELHTVAQKVTHVARSMEWFLESTFNPEGMQMDSAGYEEEIRKVTSLNAARAELQRAYAKVIEKLQSTGEDEWSKPLPQGDWMAGEPRWKVVPAIIEHTAHHRGALTVYTRLIGKVPPMPYMET